MRIAYLTTDEVNKDLAVRLAAQWHMTVCPLEPRDSPPDGEFDAVLYDWDHWPADRRPRAVTHASARPLRQPVALHGYGLEPDQARALRRCGVLLFARLEPRTFLELQRAVNQARVIREREETVDLSQKGDRVAAAQAVAEAPPREPAGNSPSCCQPRYTVRLHPGSLSLQPDGYVQDPLSGSPGLAGNRRRKVYRNRCLRCGEQAEGMAYRIAVARRQDLGYRIVHEESAFICNRCTEARLRRRACLVLFTWVPLGLLASGGLFSLAVRFWACASPFRRGNLPASGMLFIVSMGLLVVTGLLVRLACRHLHWVSEKGYQHERFADTQVTCMAIDLRKKEILSRLGLPEASVRFLTPHDQPLVVGPIHASDVAPSGPGALESHSEGNSRP
jgi:hypothetical protein